MSDQNTIDNITISVVGGILAGTVVVYASGNTIKWPPWAIALSGILMMVIMIAGMILIKYINSLFKKK